MPKKVVIIGGGLAGLSSALYLSDYFAGEISIIESSPKFGGRVTSFYDTEFEATLDNGQHLLLGCYKETFRFLKKCGSYDNLTSGKGLFLPYLLKNGKYSVLRSPNLPYPISLLGALLGFSLIPFSARIKQAMFGIKLMVTRSGSLRGKSVAQWFEEAGFNQSERELLWEIISTGALNTNPLKADAELLQRLLKVVFFRGANNYRFFVPAKPLSEVFADNAIRYLKNKISVTTGQRVVKCNFISDWEITCNNGETYRAENIICAVPPFALEKIEGLRNHVTHDINRIPYSPIVSIHLKCDSSPLPFSYCTLLQSPIQWIFKQPYGYSLVISAADSVVQLSNEQIIELACTELQKRGLIEKEKQVTGRVVREKRATIECTPEVELLRPGTQTTHPKLFLAGDWLKTGYPSTIEGAILSGKMAAEKLLQTLAG